MFSFRVTTSPALDGRICNCRHEFSPIEWLFNPLDSCLLPPRNTCHCCLLGDILVYSLLLWLMAVIPGRIIDCFSPLVVCEAPLDILRASPQGGGFQVSFSFIPPNPVSKVHGVFRSRVLHLSSRWQPEDKDSSSLYDVESPFDSPD